MDYFIGQIAYFGFDWPPQNWALCDGRTLNINEYSALFALIGIKYGGDGRSTFQLPNLMPTEPNQPLPMICLVGVFPARS
jgi:microcystin-dependent protein